MDKIVGRAEVAAFYWLRRNAPALSLAGQTSFVYCSVGPEICGGAQGGGHPI